MTIVMLNFRPPGRSRSRALPDTTRGVCNRTAAARTREKRQRGVELEESTRNSGSGCGRSVSETRTRSPPRLSQRELAFEGRRVGCPRSRQPVARSTKASIACMSSGVRSDSKGWHLRRRASFGDDGGDVADSAVPIDRICPRGSRCSPLCGGSPPGPPAPAPAGFFRD
jgi:hypothetical protein